MFSISYFKGNCGLTVKAVGTHPVSFRTRQLSLPA